MQSTSSIPLLLRIFLGIVLLSAAAGPIFADSFNPGHLVVSRAEYKDDTTIFNDPSISVFQERTFLTSTASLGFLAL